MKILRWILSPLGAVAAFIVVRIVLKLMNVAFGGYGLLVFLWNDVICEGIGAAAFVLAGAAIAPTDNKIIVAIVYATILCCLCIASLIISINLDYTFMQCIPIIVTFFGSIGGAIASYEVLDDF